MVKNYIGITVGPIIKTMSYAYTPGGLWFSSYFFSKLTAGLTERMIIENFHIINQRKKEDTGEVDSAFYRAKNNSGIGIYHDRIYASIESCSKNKIDIDIKNIIAGEIKNQAKNIQTALKLNDDELDKIESFLRGYLRVDYVIYTENEVNDSKDGLSKKLADTLDALELSTKVNSGDTDNYLANILLGDGKKGNNAYIVKHPFAEYSEGNNLKKKDSNGTPVFKEIINIASQEDALTEDDENAIKGLDKTYRYYAVVQADGDYMGKLLSVEGGELDEQETRIAAFSRLCTEYSEKAVNRIVGYGGTVIYAGGDDLLFLAPIVTSNKNIWSLCRNIGDDFIQLSQKWMKKNNVTLSEQNVKPSISFGVSINYYKSPLYEAVLDAQSLLFGTAKEFGKKNNIAISLHKHSGQTQGVVCCMESGCTDTVYARLITLVSEVYTGKEKEPDISEKEATNRLLHSVTYQLESRKDLINLMMVDSQSTDILTNLFRNKFNYIENNNSRQNQQLRAILDFIIAVCNNHSCIKGLENNDLGNIVVETLRICKFLVEGEDDD